MYKLNTNPLNKYNNSLVCPLLHAMNSFVQTQYTLRSLAQLRRGVGESAPSKFFCDVGGI